MKIYNTEVHGIEAAARAMRNPLDSWHKGDSWGEADRALLSTLARSGTEHRKVIRLIQCWATIEAPRFWWTELDTYKVGVTRMSCSTMHTLCRRELTEEDFAPGTSRAIIQDINRMIVAYKAHPTEKSRRLHDIKANLPEGFVQRADIVASYEALLAIHKQRKGHRLPQWNVVRNWIAGLPLMDVLLGEEK